MYTGMVVRFEKHMTANKDTDHWTRQIYDIGAVGIKRRKGKREYICLLRHKKYRGTANGWFYYGIRCLHVFGWNAPVMYDWTNAGAQRFLAGKMPHSPVEQHPKQPVVSKSSVTRQSTRNRFDSRDRFSTGRAEYENEKNKRVKYKQVNMYEQQEVPPSVATVHEIKQVRFVLCFDSSCFF